MRSAQLFRNGNTTRMVRSFWDPSRSQKFGKSSLNQKEEFPDPYEGNFGFTECDQYTKVSVIGAAGRVGKTLSLLLKTCPLIDHLCLFDTDKSVRGVGVDISHIDTKCNVSYVCGMRNIQQALSAPDVVIIAAGCPASPNLHGKKLFEKNAPVIAGISEACARFCPKACVILITNPINSLLPVVGSVYQIITNRIPSRRLFGLTSLDVVRANTFVAEVIRKDPSTVIVPVVGGTSQETLVPVISQMKPCRKIKRGETVALTECLKRAEENLMDCQNCGTRASSTLSTAYAGFRFTTSLVMALKGADDIIECAFVKSDVIPELEYLASPLKLGARGVEYNFGYPPLSDYELAGLEQSAAFLMADIEMGKAFVASIRDTIQKGLVWKRLTEECGKPVEEEHAPDGKLRRRRRADERRRKEPAPADEAEVRPTALTQEVYSEGVRASLRRFFGAGEAQDAAVAANSILESAACRDDPSLHGDENLEEFSEVKPSEEAKPTPDSKQSSVVARPGFLQTGSTAERAARRYHTVSRERPKTTSENRLKRRFHGEKVLMLVKRTKNGLDARMAKRIPPSKFPAASQRNQCKSLNAAAKQKFRSFNVQKKFTPSASVLLLLDKQKKERAGRNLEVVVAEDDRKKEEEGKAEEEAGQEEEGKDEEGREDVKAEPGNDKQLVVRKENDAYQDLVFKQLRDLKRENEELRKQLSKLAEDKRTESALQSESDNLELERTKLKACWLIMSSTMDAFSNFCRKFTSKTDGQLLDAAKELHDEGEEQEEMEEGEDEEEEEEEEEEEGEEFGDAREELEDEDVGEKTKKNLEYDEKYFRFLQKLMEDQMENQLDPEKKRSRMRK